jgi:3-methyladenine DNA glycosylase AlkD
MSSGPDTDLIDEIRAELIKQADPGRAPGMQAYMKSALPYLGVPVPTVRSITRSAERQRPPDSTAGLVATSTTLWTQARHREHRYAATELTNTVTGRKLLTMATLPIFEETIVTGAWWDHVDEISHRIGALLVQYPDETSAILRAWAVGSDKWLRRSSIICQIGAKANTDVALLSEAIDAQAAMRCLLPAVPGPWSRSRAVLLCRVLAGQPRRSADAH